jgi:hypothetical protein
MIMIHALTPLEFVGVFAVLAGALAVFCTWWGARWERNEHVCEGSSLLSSSFEGGGGGEYAAQREYLDDFASTFTLPPARQAFDAVTITPQKPLQYAQPAPPCVSRDLGLEMAVADAQGFLAGLDEWGQEVRNRVIEVAQS